MDLDHWREVAQSIWRHKTRTLLTAFGVFWGIFMLVALLGSGNAMKNGAMGMFKDDAVNSVFIYGNRTSKAYMGLKPGRRIQFTLDHLEALKRSVPGIEIITPRKRVDYDTRINFGPEQGTFDVRGVFPNYAFIEKTIVTQGRYLNDKDLNERRRVALVGTEIINVLFTNSADPRIRKLNPIGQYIQIAGVPFKIIGVFKDIGGDSELRRIFLPVTNQRVHLHRRTWDAFCRHCRRQQCDAGDCQRTSQGDRCAQSDRSYSFYDFVDDPERSAADHQCRWLLRFNGRSRSSEHHSQDWLVWSLLAPEWLRDTYPQNWLYRSNPSKPCATNNINDLSS